MRHLALLTLVTLAGCGDAKPQVPPRIVAGGGVADPGIDGVVHVVVIDGATNTRIDQAEVMVGDVRAFSDGPGMYTATDVYGPQTVTVGYRHSGLPDQVWVGLDSANLTVIADAQSTPELGVLAGTIAGWSAVPAPPTGHITAAIVSTSRPRSIAELEELAELPSGGLYSPRWCVREAFGGAACAWRVNARVGAAEPYAVLVDIDQRGTTDTRDDVPTVIGFASGAPRMVEAGVEQPGIVLTLAAAEDLTTAAVDFGAPPAGLPQVVGRVGVEVGERGVLRIGEVAAATGALRVPIIPGTTYELRALAEAPGDAGADSLSLRRGLTDAAALTAGAWLPPPATVTATRTSVAFDRVDGASFHVIEIERFGSSIVTTPVMTVTVLDASAAVDLALPRDGLRVRVRAVDAGPDFDPRAYRLSDRLAVVQRTASRATLLP